MNQPQISIEEVRDYWNTRPCNIRHSKLPIGTNEYFDEVERRKYFVEPHIPPFADFERWSGRRVLEVGCGIGTDAINFARAGAIYTGIELSEESLELTKKRFEVYDLPGRLLNGNAEEVDKLFQHEDFDLIYSFGVLHHTTHLRKALVALRGLMHEESELKLMLYAKHSWKSAMIAAGLDQPEAQTGCPIANTYSREEVIGELKGSGFKVNKIVQTHFFPYQVEPYKEYKYVKTPWFEAMPEGMFRALENTLGWHLLISGMIE